MAADLVAVARRKARKYGLDPSIFVKQIRAESNFDPDVTSPAGAQGIAQIMPATAKGWGVNPLNPIAALDAAAKNMAAYVKKYGGYENALRAYNAGPGAIQASRGYAETNAYVQKILGGRDPGKLNQPVSGPTTTKTVPGVDNSDLRRSLIADFIGQGGPDNPDALLGLASGLPGAGDTPSRKVTKTTPGRPVAETPVSGPKVKGTLLEMFYRGPGGINIDEGKVVGRDFVSGHEGHVHVAANPREVIRLGKMAQRMGLTVRENPAFDKVDPVHTEGSFHYSNRAIDVSGDPGKLRQFNHKVARLYGL